MSVTSHMSLPLLFLIAYPDNGPMSDYGTLYTDSVYVLVLDEYLIVFVSRVVFEYHTDFIRTCLFLFAFFYPSISL